MGQSADAKLIYGVFLADTLNDDIPEWATSAVPGDDFTWDAQDVLKEYKLEVFQHGYEFHDVSIGIELAWACDYGHTRLDLEDIQAKMEEARPLIEQLLKDWKAPSEVKPQLLMLASYC